jgi:hypothetical protein
MELETKIFERKVLKTNSGSDNGDLNGGKEKCVSTQKEILRPKFLINYDREK